VNGKPWTAAQVRALKRHYARMPIEDLERLIGRNRLSIYSRAHAMGLYRSRELLQEIGRKSATHPNIVQSQFPKGHVPANKGLRRPGWHRGRMKETQFKKGQFPRNKDPDFYVIGALRVNTDGYIDMRVSFEPGGMGWRGLHRILWEDAHGPIPKGHIIKFKDGDSLNVCLENLELITMAENCRRNSIHNLPPVLKQSIQLLGALKRTLKRRTRDAEQDRGPAEPPVRNARGAARPRQADGSGPGKDRSPGRAGGGRLGKGRGRFRASNERARRRQLHPTGSDRTA
jgi:hypothetical protein